MISNFIETARIYQTYARRCILAVVEARATLLAGARRTVRAVQRAAGRVVDVDGDAGRRPGAGDAVDGPAHRLRLRHLLPGRRLEALARAHHHHPVADRLAVGLRELDRGPGVDDGAPNLTDPVRVAVDRVDAVHPLRARARAGRRPLA